MPTRRFANPEKWPEGFLYQSNFLSETEQAGLLRTFEGLEFGAYDFRGTLLSGGWWLMEEAMSRARGVWRLRRRRFQIICGDSGSGGGGCWHVRGGDCASYGDGVFRRDSDWVASGFAAVWDHHWDFAS